MFISFTLHLPLNTINYTVYPTEKLTGNPTGWDPSGILIGISVGPTGKIGWDPTLIPKFPSGIQPSSQWDPTLIPVGSNPHPSGIPV
jgi:hypothetical protein